MLLFILQGRSPGYTCGSTVGFVEFMAVPVELGFYILILAWDPAVKHCVCNKILRRRGGNKKTKNSERRGFFGMLGF